MNRTIKRRHPARLAALLTGLLLLGAGVSAEAHDFGRRDRPTVNVRHHLPERHDAHYRQHDSRDRHDYGQNYSRSRYGRAGWRQHNRRYNQRYRRDRPDHRYASHDWRHNREHSRGFFGRW